MRFLNILLYRRILIGCAVLFIIVALVVAIGIIPPAKADNYPGVNHERITGVLGITIALNLLSAFFLFLILFRPRKENSESKPILIITGLLELILGLAFADGAFNYQTHGTSMQSASILLFICSAIDTLSGVTLIISAFLIPKNINLSKDAYLPN